MRNHLFRQHQELPAREQISNTRLFEVVVRDAAFVADIVDEGARLDFYPLSGEIRFVRFERDHQNSAGD